MKAKKLKKKVQRIINQKVKSNSNHFSSEGMDRQIAALIEVIAEYIPEKEK